MRRRLWNDCCVARKARKPWRCRCADQVRAIRVAHDGREGSSSSGWASATADTVDAVITRYHEWGYRNVRVEEVPNPDYRPDCEGDIAPGTRYVEDVSENGMYQSGYRYCMTCAVAMGWTGKRDDGLDGLRSLLP